ncbi:hypothetical protein GDO86_009761 [Hymenochirus boettgeri]|uniref:Uncharacterized protein n=1 Tax=Hymenochirus boettgeri TaxID=247094 RepID=A0A8T2JMI8_9PIPI|nr:hypothetical protein GDO86_009761 [Hymenochirus boettgeri]
MYKTQNTEEMIQREKKQQKMEKKRAVCRIIHNTRVFNWTMETSICGGRTTGLHTLSQNTLPTPHNFLENNLYIYFCPFTLIQACAMLQLQTRICLAGVLLWSGTSNMYNLVLWCTEFQLLNTPS